MPQKLFLRILLLAFLLFVAGAQPSYAGSAPSADDIGLEIIPDELEPYSESTAGRFSTRTGLPLTLYGINYPVTEAAPETMARQYLRENASVLQLHSPTLADLSHQFTRSNQAGYTVRFDQLAAGIPVYRAEIVVHINLHAEVTYVTNDYRSDIGSFDAEPNMTTDEARQIAHDYLTAVGPMRYDETQLVVYHNKNVTRLAYRVAVEPRAPLGSWEVLVDAQTGEIFKAVDNALHDEAEAPEQNRVLVDGSGLVWDPDPLTSATATYGDPGFSDGGDGDTTQLNNERVAVTLPDITLSGGLYTLQGPYAWITDSEAPNRGLFSQASSTFNFTRSQNAFEAVVTYYHVDASMRYINDTLGLNITPFQYPNGVRFDPHGLNGADNSHYLGGSGQIAFGEGGVDDAEDSDVIHHELAHGLHDWVTNGNLSQVNGLSEGTGDYWAQSYNRSVDSWTPADPAYHYVFRWDGHNPFWNGRVTNYGASYPGGLTGQIHTDGQIWSTCNMKVYDAIGKTNTDLAFWEGLGMTGGSSSQNDAANAVFQAAIDMGYSNADLQAIHDEYSSCGYILPPFSAPGVVISKSANPTPVTAGQQLTYNLTLENNDSVSAANVIITDPIPANTTFVNGSSTCGGAVVVDTLTIPMGNMPAGAVQNCQFQVAVSGSLSGPTVLFTDDMEGGSAAWSATHGSGSADWSLVTAAANSPTHSWFAQDVASVTDQRLAMASAVTLGSDARLRFWHSYNSEAGYDGGVVEISLTGGRSWNDLGGAISQNGYSGTISTGSGSPIAGRQAFTGNSGGFIETIVDLSSYAGDSVLFRFRMTTDSSIGGIGWYVDDVTIEMGGDAITNTACVNYDGGSENCDTVVTMVESAAPTAVTTLTAVAPASLTFMPYSYLALLLGLLTMLLWGARRRLAG